MNYEGLPCPVCGRHLHENDDVVVCPDCGTPQHRECWLEEGHCANAGRHEEGFVWGADSVPAPPAPEMKLIHSDMKICPSCGSENPADSPVCGKCGSSLEGGEIRLSLDEDGIRRCPYCGMTVEQEDKLCRNCGAPLILIPDSYGSSYSADSGFAGAERIGGITADELSRYVRKNVKRYIPLFDRFEKGKKFSFNFGAFFFGPLWYFFRKLYKFGIIFIILIAAVSPVFATMSSKMMDVMEPYQQAVTDGTLSNDDAVKMLAEVVAATRNDFALGTGLMILLNLVFALLADRLYYKKIKDDFEILKSGEVEPNIQRAMILRRGGTSLLSALCGFFTFRIASYIMVIIANYVAMNF